MALKCTQEFFLDDSDISNLAEKDRAKVAMQNTIVNWWGILLPRNSPETSRTWIYSLEINGGWGCGVEGLDQEMHMGKCICIGIYDVYKGFQRREQTWLWQSVLRTRRIRFRLSCWWTAGTIESTPARKLGEGLQRMANRQKAFGDQS